MKKFMIFLMFIGVVSSPIDLKEKLNMSEDIKILNRYIEHLEDINIDDFKNMFIVEENKDEFNNSVMDFSEFNNSSIDNALSDNFEVDEQGLKKLVKKEISIELSKKIRDNILEMYKVSEIQTLYVDGNTDIEEIDKIKKMLIEYAEEKINYVGKLEKGSLINDKNKDNTIIYNNIIELDI